MDFNQFSHLSLTAARPARDWRRRCPPGGPGLPGDRVQGREAGRAEITGSREGAKPRSPDERRTILALIDFRLNR